MRKSPYSVGTAVAYAVVLLLILWWLPVIGPIIIGYITGRKAGGPVKGVLAMSVPILLHFALVFAVSHGLIHIPFIFSPEFIGSIVSILHPLPISSLLNYIETTLKLAMGAGTYFENYLYYAPPSFFIMLSFSFIGGAVSRMAILEHGISSEEKSSFFKRSEVKRGVRPFILPEDVKEREEERSKTHPVKESKRGPKRFEDENEKFVVHPVESKQMILSKKKINRESSLTYL